MFSTQQSKLLKLPPLNKEIIKQLKKKMWAIFSPYTKQYKGLCLSWMSHKTSLRRIGTFMREANGRRWYYGFCIMVFGRCLAIQTRLRRETRNFIFFSLFFSPNFLVSVRGNLVLFFLRLLFLSLVSWPQFE